MQPLNAPGRRSALLPSYWFNLPLSLVLLASGLGGCTAAVDSNGRPRNTGTGPNSPPIAADPNNPNPQGTGGTGPSPTATTTGPLPPGACAPDASLANARIWRLTDPEYVNVVRQVFGVSINPEVSSAQSSVENLNLADSAGVNAANATNYQTSARIAAGQMVQNLASLMPCGTATPDTACVEQFVRTSVARAYRRPLADAEVTDLLALYTLGLADSPSVGVRLILETVLQSANFVWRTEIGEGATSPAVGTKVTLTPFEVASAVSFFLQGSAPDDSLWAKAQDGSLLTAGVLSQEVDRLLAQPEVRTNLTADAAIWLGLGRLKARPKDAALFPEFTPAASDALLKSGEAFLGETMWNGQFTDFFSSKKIFLNQELAALYGVPGVTGSQLVPVDVTTAERSAGLLSQPAVLAAHASPSESDVVHRGLFVFRSLVCGATIPKPAANAVREALAALPADSTQKEFANFRAQNPSCQGCHSQFDPFGLAQERYDALGRFQQTDAKGQPIDDTSTIISMGQGIDGPVAGTTELAARLSTARRVADCAVTNLSTIALGQDTKQDMSCALRTVQDSFATSGSFPELFRSLLASPGFATRDVK
ncbi:MAG: DUF1592 domain-containing protein [Polyangiaceae bacterium]|nr:DUF1592 domain-containing protein [Polyangiaceae bacterium]